MRQYLEMCEYILKNGVRKNDRTNTGTISCFGYQTRYDLQKGFPLLTTKKVHLKSVIHELLWFISGSTNIKYLVDNDVKIWNEWAYEKYTKKPEYKNETLFEFIEKIKESNQFASKHGDLGPVYGKQWRDFLGVDQIQKLVDSLTKNPDSRRHIVSAWNPSEVDSMALPPCHAFIQFYVANNKLSCQLYQRSADVFLGVPFNIASYSLLTMMLAQVCHLDLGEFIHTLGDAHIYINHLDQINLQLSRETKELPTMKINESVRTIFDFKYADFTLLNYHPHPPIKGEVAV